MYIHIDRPLKCAQCSSTRKEYVQQGNDKFVRCLDCGHEGSKTKIIPENSGTMSKYMEFLSNGDEVF